MGITTLDLVEEAAREEHPARIEQAQQGTRDLQDAYQDHRCCLVSASA